MRELKKSHKNLMIFEAGFIYCKRYSLDYETFIDDVFMKPEFNSEENSEFDKICKDLRQYVTFKNYQLLEITQEEYDMCVDKFGEN